MQSNRPPATKMQNKQTTTYRDVKQADHNLQRCKQADSHLQRCKPSDNNLQGYKASRSQPPQMQARPTVTYSNASKVDYILHRRKSSRPRLMQNKQTTTSRDVGQSNHSSHRGKAFRPQPQEMQAKPTITYSIAKKVDYFLHRRTPSRPRLPEMKSN